MKWQIKWLSSLGMAMVPGGEQLYRHIQERFGELKDIEKSTRFDNAEFFLKRLQAEHHADGHRLRVVELGTGWIPAIPLTLLLAGIRVETFDVKRLVDHMLFLRTRDVLRQRTQRIADLSGVSLDDVRQRQAILDGSRDFETACQRLGGRYLAPCETSQLPLEENSVDVVISNLVLQCIPQAILPDVLSESHRILRPGGLALHRIRMTDEYAPVDPHRNHLHYLTYSDRTWNRWFNHSLKHLNRNRLPNFRSLFEEAGFQEHACHREIDHDSLAYLETLSLAERFRDMALEDVVTVGAEIELAKPNAKQAPHERHPCGVSAMMSPAC